MMPIGTEPIVLTVFHQSKDIACSTFFVTEILFAPIGDTKISQRKSKALFFGEKKICGAIGLSL